MDQRFEIISLPNHIWQLFVNSKEIVSNNFMLVNSAESFNYQINYWSRTEVEVPQYHLSLPRLEKVIL